MKNTKKKNNEIEKENEEFLKNVDNGQLYEGLVCLDIKLSKLIDILEPVAKYIEDKRAGTLTI